MKKLNSIAQPLKSISLFIGCILFMLSFVHQDEPSKKVSGYVIYPFNVNKKAIFIASTTQPFDSCLLSFDSDTISTIINLSIDNVDYIEFQSDSLFDFFLDKAQFYADCLEKEENHGYYILFSENWIFKEEINPIMNLDYKGENYLMYNFNNYSYWITFLFKDRVMIIKNVD